MNGPLVLGKLALAIGAIGVMAATPAAPGDAEAGVLYCFLTPESEAAAAGAKRAKEFATKHPGDVRLRPVLLAKDFTLLRTLTESSPLYRTIKELESGSKPGALDVPLFDEEGLRLAERWGVRSVPAFVLVRGGRAHATAGASANLELLWECAR